MSTSIAILMILSAYPGGRASFQSLKADLAVLSTREWLARTRALAAKAGRFNLFTDGLATRDQTGWVITQAGRTFLEGLSQEGASGLRSERPVLRLVASNATGSVKDAVLRPANAPERFAS